MPDDDRRSGAELRSRRELLGLNIAESATILGVDERIIRRWEQGRSIPEGVLRDLAGLERTQDELVVELEDLARQTGRIETYRGDDVVPGRANLPARWHRVAAATAVRNLAVDGVEARIVYVDDQD